MFFKKFGDLIVSIFFIVLSIAMMIAAQALPKSKVIDIGPDFMPMVIGAVSLILAVALLVITLMRFKANAEKLANETPEVYDYKRVLLSILLMLVYVFTFKPIGFIVATLIYLPLQITVLAPDDKRTKKDIILYVVIDVIFTLAVFFLFRYGFKIMMPAGIFTINL